MATPQAQAQAQAHPSLLLSNSSPQPQLFYTLRQQTVLVHGRARTTRFKCSATTGTGFFSRLGRLIKEKAKSDVEKIVSGFSKTRDNLAVIDELLLYWNLSEIDRVLDEREEITIKIVESLWKDILAGKFKSGTEIKL